MSQPLMVDIPAQLGERAARLRRLDSSTATIAFEAPVVAPAVGTLATLYVFFGSAEVVPAPVIARVTWRSADGAECGIEFSPGAARSVELTLRTLGVAATKKKVAA